MIRLSDAIPGTVRLRRKKSGEWLAVQQGLPPPHDNCQAATWIRIENTGAARRAAIEVRFADPKWMAHHEFGYLQANGRCRVIPGELLSKSARYVVAARRGVSHFGICPWYDNDRAARFLERIGRHPNVTLTTLGHSAQGRALRCAIIARKGRAARRDILVLAREHGNETSGSFAMETVAAYLLSPHGEALLRENTFHLVPVVNPDGVAAGLKVTRPGPAAETDPFNGGWASDDPVCRAMRQMVSSLRPAGVLTYHNYLDPNPGCFVLEKADALAMLDHLLDVDTWISAVKPAVWSGREVKSVWVVNRIPPGNFVWSRWHREYRPAVLIAELPWHGRTIEEVSRLGLGAFLGIVEAARRRC